MKGHLMMVTALLLGLAGCHSDSSKAEKGVPSSEANVLKDYIQKPKDRAVGVKEDVERTQKKIDETLEELDEE